MNFLSPYPRCADAADFFARLMADALANDAALANVSTRLSDVGVDILALVDHWTLPHSPDLAANLTAWGFAEEVVDDGERVWFHPAARLPRVRVGEQTIPALAVDDVRAFFSHAKLTAQRKQGKEDSAYKTASVEGAHFQVVTRRGYRGFVPGDVLSANAIILQETRKLFSHRLRKGDEKAVIRDARDCFMRAAGQIGTGRAVDEFFSAERDYYLGRNTAARWQGKRQQEAGIGWANHDHHTYRCSRESFQPLMRLWQHMGFTFRERFYAGADAGWGAQILEHPTSRVVLFCDVDMAPEELNVDFAEQSLPPRDALGTIGLWCALHGSSIAEAGMHHLECEFDFQKCEEGLKAAGFGVMRPFTDLPMLKQAFTVPELWPVDSDRLTKLVADGLLTTAQAAQFNAQGAAGSHLEILQRWEGFKGFNKTGVSEIIRDTDARQLTGTA